MFGKIKHFTISKIIDLAYSIDKSMGWDKDFSYETLPYCGHHHSGHNGRLTKSHYHEGDGGISVGNSWMRLVREEVICREPKCYITFEKPRRFGKTIGSIRINSYRTETGKRFTTVSWTRYGAHRLIHGSRVYTYEPGQGIRRI